MDQTVIIRLEDISFGYGDEKILDNISLNIRDKEFLTLLGPSGCGKTTTLRIIGGFIFPSDGKLFFNNENITSVPPYKRMVNTVFQKYALFSHLSVFDNVAFGLKIKKLDKAEIKRRVKKMLSITNLDGFENRKINQLSGGQQQRVAIARALVNHPNVLLLDEPLGALDLKLRKEMQLELKNIQKKMGITFIYVTHDQEEALTMSDRIVVMNDGEIQQIGTPQDIYNEPTNAFVADFIGESNIIDGVMVRDRLIKIADIEFKCVDTGFNPDQLVDVVIRPEDIKIVDPADAVLNGQVESSIFKGVHYEITVDCCNLKWLIHTTKTANIGSTVGILFEPQDIHVMEKLFRFDKNYIKGKVVGSNRLELLNTELELEDIDYPIDTEVQAVIHPKFIEIVSTDKADVTGYLESLIYKGAYNELIVYVNNQSIMVYSQIDEQVGTDVGLKFNLDKIKLNPISTPKGVE